jgi:hypothetical protein
MQPDIRNAFIAATTVYSTRFIPVNDENADGEERTTRIFTRCGKMGS